MRVRLTIVLFFCSALALFSQTTATKIPTKVTAGKQFQLIELNVTSALSFDSVAYFNKTNTNELVVVEVKQSGQPIQIQKTTARPTSGTYVTWSYDTLAKRLNVLTRTSSPMTGTLQIYYVQNIPTVTQIRTDTTQIYRSTTLFRGTNIVRDTVVADTLAVLSLEKPTGEKIDTVTLSADETLSIVARGKDLYGNLIKILHSTWQVEGDAIGTITPSANLDTGKFSATKVGVGRIRARFDTTFNSTSHSFTSTTGLLRVTHGQLNSLSIRTAPDGAGDSVRAVTMKADSTLTLYSAGYDSDNNYIRDTSANWSKTGTLDPISGGPTSKVVFVPKVSGTSGQIITRIESLPSVRPDTTGTITIIPGTITSLRIANGAGDTLTSLHLNADTTIVLTLRGYDTDGNFVDSLHASWSDSGNNDLGSFSDTSGKHARFAVSKVGSGIIKATANGLNVSLYVQVTNGKLEYLKILSSTGGDGVTIGSMSLKTDSTLTLTAAGYDNDGNYIRDTIANWSSDDPKNPVSNVPSSSIIFNPVELSQSVRISVRIIGLPSVRPDTTGAITIIPGTITSLRIANGAGDTLSSLHLNADTTIVLTLRGYDADGNFVDSLHASWSDSGNNDLGSFSDTSGKHARFAVSKVGSGIIKATANGLNVSLYVQVTSGKLDYLKILSSTGGAGVTFGNMSLKADSSLPLYAAGYDSDENYIRDTLASWTSNDVFNPVPSTASSRIVFNPVLSGRSVRVIATATGLPSVGSDTTGTMTIIPGSITSLRIANGAGDTLTSLHLNADTTIVLRVNGYDIDGNFVDSLHAMWSDSSGNDLGVFSDTSGRHAQFAVSKVGSGIIKATANGLAVNIYTEVTVGRLVRLAILSASHGDGNEIGAMRVPSDSTITMFAAGFDADTNYLPDIQVDWRVSNPFAWYADSTGLQFTIFPYSKRDSGYVWIQSGPVRDTTGVIQIYTPTTLSYQPGTLFPTNIHVSSDTGFQFTLNNFGDIGVILDTRSHLFFADNSGDTIRAYIPPNVTISSNSSIPIITSTVAIPFTLEGETYLPQFYAYGVDSMGRDFNQGSIAMEANGLHVLSLRIVSITPERQTVTRGQDSVFVRMQVRNYSDRIVSNLRGTLEFAPNVEQWEFLDTTALIAPGTERTLEFLVHIGVNSITSFDTIWGTVAGMVVIGMDSTLVGDISRSVIGIWKVMEPPNFEYISSSLNKKKVTQGQEGVRFTISINNAGETGVILDSTNSFIRFTDDIELYIARLSPTSHFQVGGNSVDTLEFVSNTIANALTPGRYQQSIHLEGIDSNGVAYTTTINGDTVLVQTPVHIVPDVSTFQPDTVTSGQEVSFRVRLHNRGEASAILYNDKTKLSFDTFYTANLLGDTLIPGRDSTEIAFTPRPIREDIPIQSYTPKVVYEGIDDNGKPFNDSISFGMLLIQSPPVIRFDNLLLPAKVTSGNNVSFRVDVRNTTDAGVLLNQDSCILSVHVSGNEQLKSRLDSSYIIPGDSAQNVALFFEPMIISSDFPDTFFTSLDLAGNDFNGKPYRQNNITLDSVVINHSQLSITDDSFVPQNATRGQQGISFSLKVRNTGTIPIQLDSITSLTIYGESDSIQRLLQFPPPRIPVNDSTDIHFDTCFIPDLFALGYRVPEVRFHGVDDDGYEYTDTLFLHDSIRIQEPPEIFYVQNSLFPLRLTQGQEGIRFRVLLKNLKETVAIFDKDSSNLKLILGFDTLTRVLLSPDTLQGFDSAFFQFDYLQIPFTPGISALPQISLQGQDINGAPFQILLTTGNDSIQIKQGPKIEYIAQSNFPDSVTQGQTTSFRVLVKNTGDVPVILRTNSEYQFNSAGTYIQAMLRDSVEVFPNDSSYAELVFDSVMVDSLIDAGSYSPKLIIRGMDENGKDYLTTDSLENGELNVQSPPQLRATTIMGEKKFTEGGDAGIQLQVLVHNDGDVNAILNTSTWVEFPPGDSNALREYLPTDTTIASMDSMVLMFIAEQIPESIVPGTYRLKLHVSGVDGNGKPFEAETISSDSVEVQRAPILSYLGGSNTSDSVTIGQRVQFKVEMRNSGGTGVVIDSAGYRFDGGIVHASMESDWVRFDSNVVLVFDSITISTQANRGIHTPVVYFKGIDDNGSTYRNSVRLDSDEVRVFAPPVLEVDALSLEPDTVTRGQRVWLRLTVTNRESLDVWLDTVRTWLRFSDSIYTFESVLDTPRYIQVGAMRGLSYQPQTVDERFQAGVYDVVLEYYCRDANGYEKRIQLTGDTVRITVQNPPDIHYVAESLTPKAVTDGQDTSFTLMLSNSGSVSVTLPADSTILSIPGLSKSARLVSPVTLEAGSDSVLLQFERIEFADTVTGRYAVELTIDTLDENGHGLHMTLQPNDTLEVQRRPRIVTTASRIQPTRVSLGQKGVGLKVEVVNRGEAIDTLDTRTTITFGSYRSQLSDTMVLLPNISSLLEFDTVGIGEEDLNIYYHPRIDLFGRDSNGKGFLDSLKIDGDSIKVDTPPQFRATEIVSRKKFTQRGDAVIQLQVKVYNDGEADANLDTNFTWAEFPPRDTNVFRVYLQAPLSIPSDDFTILPFTSGTIHDSILQGIYHVRLHLQGEDVNGKPFDEVLLSTDTIEVQQPPSLSYRGGSNTRDSVTIGQRVQFKVDLSNSGGVGVMIDSCGNRFDGGIVHASMESDTIRIDSAVSLVFDSITISSQAHSGIHTPVVYFKGIDDNRSTYRDSVRLDSSEVRVFAPPVLEVHASSLEPDTVTRGQRVWLRLTVTNKESLDVWLDTIGTQLSFSDSIYTLKSALDTMRYIPGGARREIAYKVLPIVDEFLSGTYSVPLEFYGRDANGYEQRIRTTGDTVRITIQNPPDIEYVSESLTPKVVTDGQDTSFTLMLSNSGSVSVTLPADNTELRIPGLGKSARLVSPVVLPSGRDSVPLQFERIEFADTVTGRYAVELTIDTLDENGHGLHMTLQPNDTLEVQRRPRIETTENRIDPTRVSQGQNGVGLKVEVVNRGEVSIALDTSTTITFGSYRSKLSDTMVLLPNLSSLLEFDTTVIAKEDSNIYYHPRIDLIGRDSNGERFLDSLRLNGDSIKVDTKAGILIHNYANNDSEVTIGWRNVPFKFFVEDTGDADYIIDNVDLTFFHESSAVAYKFTPPSYSQVIRGDATDSVTTKINIGNITTDDTVSILASVRGRDANTGNRVDRDSIFVHTWFVRHKPVLDITDLFLSDFQITEGQTKPWKVTLEIKNRALDTIVLQRAFLQIYSGNSLAPGFDADEVFTFDSSDNEFIYPDTTKPDYITFEVDTTGYYVGNGVLMLRAVIYGKEKSTQIDVGDSVGLAPGSSFSMILLRKGEIEILDVKSKMAEYDSAQTDTFQMLTVRFRNNGERTLDSLWAREDSLHFLVNGVEDLTYDKTIKYLPDTIAGDSTDSMFIRINTVGTMIGNVSFSCKLFGSSEHVRDTTFDSITQSTFVVERPALVTIDSVSIASPFTNIVHQGQTVGMSVRIANLGEDRTIGPKIVINPSSDFSWLPKNQDDTSIASLDSLGVREVDYLLHIDENATGTIMVVTNLDPGNAENTQAQADSLKLRDTLYLTVQNLPPLISSVRFIDGGYKSVPDGRINEGDIIKVKFSQNVTQASTFGYPASKYFSLYPPTNTFGSNDLSIVRKADAVGYSGTDSASIMFVELHDSTALLNTHNNSFKTGSIVEGDSNYTFDVSLLYINPAIDTALIRGVNGNDAGLLIYRDTLSWQLRDTADFRRPSMSLNKYAIIAEDSIPPVMLDFVPSSKDENTKFSEYSTVKAMITGKNYIRSTDLQNLTYSIFKGTVDTINVRTENYPTLTELLKGKIGGVDDSLVSKFRDSLKHYHLTHIFTSIEGLQENPLARFYVPVRLDSIQFKTSYDTTMPTTNWTKPSKVISPEEVKQDNLSYNFVIENKKSLGKNGKVYYWFEAPVAGRDTSVRVVNSFFLKPSEEGNTADAGYMIRTAPNPVDLDYESRIVIEYELTSADGVDVNVEIVIIDSGGKVVAHWSEGNKQTGRYRTATPWDGRNAGGNKVARGVYLALLKVGGEIRASWVIAVK